MAVAVLTVYEIDDPPIAGGSATPLGTIDRLLSLEVSEILSTKGLNAVEFQVNRHDDPGGLLVAGRWVTVTFPYIHTDPVMTVRLSPSHTVVVSSDNEGGELIHAGGLGILSLTEHARLLEIPSAPSPPASAERGSSDVPGRWQWRTQPFGAILTRGFEEGQNHVGQPLAPITITFDRDTDSDGNAWVSLAPDRFFEINTNAAVRNLYLRGAEAGDVYLVERPGFDVDAYSGFGTASFGIDRTSASFGAGKVRIHAEPDVYSNILTGLEEDGEDERYTHVSVHGANETFVTVADPTYTSEPGRMAAIDYADSDDPDMLERVGLEFLRRQHNRTIAREVEITPGDDPANGRYLPWKHLVVGDLHTIDAGGIDEAARLVAFRVELVEGAHDATPDDAHRSLRVVLEYNEASSDDGEGASSFSESGLCCGPRPPTPTVPPTGGEVVTGTLYHTFSLFALQAADGLTLDAAWDHFSSNTVRQLGDPADTHLGGGTGTTWAAVNAAASKHELAPFARQLDQTTGLLEAVQGGATWTSPLYARSRSGVGINEANQQNFADWCARIFRPGVGFIATLWDVGDFTGTNRFHPNTTHRSRVWSAAGAAVPGAVGTDVLLVEYGLDHVGPVTGGTGGAIVFNDKTTVADLPAVDDVLPATNLRTWLSFGFTGAGTGGVIGDGHPDIIGTPGAYTPINGRNFVLRDRMPTVDDDITQGYPAGTLWIHVDDVDNPTEIFSRSISLSDAEGEALWVLDGPNPHGHAPAGITVDDGITEVAAVTTIVLDGATVTDEGDGTVTIEGFPGGGSAIVAHEEMGAAETFDASEGAEHEAIIDDDVTMTLAGAVAGERAWLTMKFIDDGGGPYAMAWPGSMHFPGEVAPPPPPAGGVLIVSAFSDDGGTNWYGSFPGTTTPSLTVEDDEAGTSVAEVEQLQFEADHFTVEDLGSGVAKVSLVGGGSSGGVMPLSATVGGIPMLVWDEDNNLIPVDA